MGAKTGNIDERIEEDLEAFTNYELKVKSGMFKMEEKVALEAEARKARFSD